MKEFYFKKYRLTTYDMCDCCYSINCIRVLYGSVFKQCNLLIQPQMYAIKSGAKNTLSNSGVFIQLLGENIVIFILVIFGINAWNT